MPFTPESFTAYTFLSHPRISPDGKKVVYQAAQARPEKNDYATDLWLWDPKADTALKLTHTGKEQAAVWEDDTTVLFGSGRDQTEPKFPYTRFYRIRTDGGEAASAFCIPLQVSRIEPLGDGEWILTGEYDPQWENLPQDKKERALFLEEKEKEKDWTALEEIPFWFNGQGYTNKKRNRLYRYSEKDRSLTPLTGPRTEVHSFSLHADKTRAVCVLQEPEDKMELDAQIGIVDLVSDEIRLYDPLDGSSIHFAEFAGDDIFFAATDRTRHGLNEDPHLYVLYADGTRERITSDTFSMSIGSSVNSDLRRGGGFPIRTDDTSLYFIATTEHESQLFRIEKDGTIHTVARPDGSVDAIDVRNGECVYVGMQGLSAQELYHTNGAHTAHNQNVPKPRTIDCFNFESRGETRTGYVLAPDTKKDAAHPSILLIHGGPKTVYGTVLHHEMQLLAEEGFYVFFTNPFGSDGYGRAFMDLRGKYGTHDYEDLMALTDAFLKNHPDADPQRVGVMGGSYGGWMTNWIIGHTDRFAAACSQRSISNWISFFGNSDIGYYFTPDQAGTDPWTDATKLWDNSPVKYADRVKTPTLFIHSDEDYRCWLPEGLQMYTALKYHGIDSRMIVFHGENHELSRSGKPRARIKRLEEIIAWFRRYLMK